MSKVLLFLKSKSIIVLLFVLPLESVKALWSVSVLLGLAEIFVLAMALVLFLNVFSNLEGIFTWVWVWVLSAEFN